jgi:hypothetical protein
MTIGAIFPARYFDHVVGRNKLKFDWRKLAWLGSPVTAGGFYEKNRF